MSTIDLEKLLELIELKKLKSKKINFHKIKKRKRNYLVKSSLERIIGTSVERSSVVVSKDPNQR